MKKIISKVSWLSLLGFLLPLLAKAQVSIQLNLNTGLGTRPLIETIVGIIQVIIGFLGIVALIIVLIGGFKWMTAAGNEEKVAEAKKLLGAGVIGLVIILAAWAITTFVIGALINATGGGVTGSD